MVTVQQFPSGPLQTNAYILACDETQQGVILDPAPESEEALVKGSSGLEIRAIFLTHSHWDHIGDLKKVATHFGAPVFVHPADRENVVHPGADQLRFPIEIEGVEPDFDLSDGDVLNVGTLKVRVIETPGHTPGGVCFYLDQEKILFSGDTLFKGSIGILSLPTSNPQAMWPSLRKLSRLPSETVVYPGHGLSTTIGAEQWLPKAEELFS